MVFIIISRDSSYNQVKFFPPVIKKINVYFLFDIYRVLDSAVIFVDKEKSADLASL